MIKAQKILWDFNIIYTGRRPDIVVVDKQNSEAAIFDIALPGNSRVKDEELDKIVKYQNLALEISGMWNVKTRVITNVICAFGAKPHC